MSEAESIILTDAAVNKIKQLVEMEDNQHLMLRVFVTGGGCAGFQYGFTFDEEQAEDDTCISKGGASVLVDMLSIQYLAGSELNYIEGLEGARFVINNPQAETTCGCGSSFSI
ncbi:iron-sulfur cluster insertion protein ErpA [Gynuella sp.]|uniref:iron-sulfur cluster insertion protein ErpA n=1 Tax=Gynuella sp. TaxID=2969146 RepID=UPI003D13012F